ncbi:MAG: hypothetical protein PWQ77_889 [Kosmotogales bacterium]|nr:hypothetical protein [Kosmotogales bacterium]
MSKIFLLLFISFLILTCSLFSMQIVEKFPVGLMPTKMEKIENSSGIFYVILIKGDSQLMVLNESYKPVIFIDEISNDGVNDFIYKNGKIYCFGFFSGRLIIIDASSYPSSWTVTDKISTGSKLLTGVVCDKKLAVLTYDKKFLLIDTSSKRITKTINLPVEALTIVTDGKYFYISLYYNYEIKTEKMMCDYGVLIYDTDGKLVKNLEAGKRPSYMIIDNEYLIVVSYLSQEIKIFSTKNFSLIHNFKIGEYPNFPFIDNYDNLYLPSTGNAAVHMINLNDFSFSNIYVNGRGPIKVLRKDKYIYILNIISGTLEKRNLINGDTEELDIDGYGIDMIMENEYILVLLQEDWTTLYGSGALQIISLD